MITLITLITSKVLVEMLSDIRDFLLTNKIVFFFVGDVFLPTIITHRRRIGQIFFLFSAR